MRRLFPEPPFLSVYQHIKEAKRGLCYEGWIKIGFGNIGPYRKVHYQMDVSPDTPLINFEDDCQIKAMFTIPDLALDSEVADFIEETAVLEIMRVVNNGYLDALTIGQAGIVKRYDVEISHMEHLILKPFILG